MRAGAMQPARLSGVARRTGARIGSRRGRERSRRDRSRFSGRFSASTLRAKATAARRQVAVDDLVDRPSFSAFAGDRIAADDHRQRLLDADQARQPLRAAGARAGGRA